MDRHHFLAAQHWLTYLAPAWEHLHDNCMVEEMLFKGHCCFHLNEETTTSAQSVSFPQHIIYFSVTNEMLDHTQLEFELRLRIPKDEQIKEDNNDKQLLLACFDGRIYQMDHKQIEKLCCTGLKDKEAMGTKPPFARFIFPFVSLQIYPTKECPWNEGCKSLSSCIQKMIAMLSPSKDGTSADNNTPFGVGAKRPSAHQAKNFNSKKQRTGSNVTNKVGIMETGFGGKEEQWRKSHEERRAERKDKQLSTESEHEEPEHTRKSVCGEGNQTLEKAKKMYWEDWVGFVQNVSMLDDTKPYFEMKPQVPFPLPFDSYFSSHAATSSPRSKKTHDLHQSTKLNKLAKLHQNVLLQRKSINKLKTGLNAQRDSLEHTMDSVMEELFPEGALRACDASEDKVQIDKLDALQTQLKEVYELELLVDLMEHRVKQ